MKNIVVGIVAVILTTALPADACSAVACVGAGDELRPGFAVKVTHDGKPLAGVSVKVTMANNEKRFSGLTGSDGTVYVKYVHVGEYWLTAEYLGVLAAYQCFHIEQQPSRKAKKHLAFEWGNYAPAIRQVAGKFVDSQPGAGGTNLLNMTHRTEVPVRSATLKLKNALTGVDYAATSNDAGEFSFPNLPKGTYVLHVDSGTTTNNRGYEATDLVLDISDKAHSDSLLLTHRDAVGGSCGGISLDLR